MELEKNFALKSEKVLNELCCGSDHERLCYEWMLSSSSLVSQRLNTKRDSINAYGKIFRAKKLLLNNIGKSERIRKRENKRERERNFCCHSSATYHPPTHLLRLK